MARHPALSRETLRYMAGVRPIVGRDAELEQLTNALQDARQGRGGVWFVSGEPGIGKTRLVEEVAERALAAGVAVHWGRAWEVGGAPAYWPWIEVLRGLRRGDAAPAGEQAFGRHAPVLAQLLPELGAGDGSTLPLGGERGRFELLDAVALALCDNARDAPLVTVLEDLHVADEATVSVLELLLQQARSSNLLVIGTLRDADARAARVGAALSRLAQGPRCLELGRLDRARVGEFLDQTPGAAPSEATRDAVYRITEGNPLFVVEVSRLLSEQRDRSETLELAVPRSVRHAIRARLERLSARARAALDVASVLGRQFRAAGLAGLAERPLADLAAPLTEALDAGIISEIAPATYRFSHVLLREVLHLDLSEERRSALHWDAADALRRRSAPEAPWSEIAHHLLEAGPAARQAAVEACCHAAEASQRQLAFPDAVEWFTRALAALGQDPSSDLERRGPLLLSLAGAQCHAGAVAAGQATCRRALELARQLGDGELLARAALSYGSVLQYAVVDSTLVGLLEEAQRALPEGPGRTRAVVMARLAAAEQPAPDPENGFRLARAAIAMARAEGDPETLLQSMRFGISALMDLAAPSERLPLNVEYVRLAEAHAQPLEALRGSMRLAFDQLELGDIAAMNASIEAIERLTARFGHPFYTWRAHAFRGLQAILAGRAADAERMIARAEQLGLAGGDPTAATALAFQRHALARALGYDEEVLSAMPRLSQLLSGRFGALAARIMTAEALLRAGRAEQAAAHLHPGDLHELVGYGDVSTFPALANVALGLALPDVADAALSVLETRPRVFASGGMTAMSPGEPVSLIQATLHRAAGRLDAADECYGQALTRARHVGAVPFEIWTALEHADLLLALGRHESNARARALAQLALGHAARLEAPGLELRARACASRAEDTPAPGATPLSRAPTPGAANPPLSGSPAVTLERDGESWLICCGEIRLRLSDSKGVSWLSQLVREPNREFHVLDLSSLAGTLDAGDAGELLDARARQEYRQRVRSLEKSLAEARDDNDGGRAERLAAELEFLQAELARALGLGGRDRRAGAAAERARINVQRRLRDALRRITLQHAELGQMLERSLKTGLYCSYRP